MVMVMSVPVTMMVMVIMMIVVLLLHHLPPSTSTTSSTAQLYSQCREENESVFSSILNQSLKSICVPEFSNYEIYIQHNGTTTMVIQRIKKVSLSTRPITNNHTVIT